MGGDLLTFAHKEGLKSSKKGKNGGDRFGCCRPKKGKDCWCHPVAVQGGGGGLLDNLAERITWRREGGVMLDYREQRRATLSWRWREKRENWSLKRKSSGGERPPRREGGGEGRKKSFFTMSTAGKKRASAEKKKGRGGNFAQAR